MDNSRKGIDIYPPIFLKSQILLGQEGYTLPGGSLGELAARAIDMLEQKLNCFGITEDFDRSLLIFAEVLGWKKPPIYRRRNTKDSGSLLEIEARHIDKIRELNLIDLEVYQRARVLFNSRVLKYGKELDSDLADFQSKLQGWHAVFPAIDLARYMRRKFAP